jgi:YggT family protein
MRPQPLSYVVVALLLSFLALSSEAFIPQQRLSSLPGRSAAVAASARSRPTSSASILRMMVEPSSVLLMESGTPAMLLAASTWVAPAKTIIEPILDLGGFAFLIRIVLSWYPQVDLNKLPANIIAWPTEPFLQVTRVVVPPAFGVDISPIIWFAFLNFLREILVSDQGILTLLQQK